MITVYQSAACSTKSGCPYFKSIRDFITNIPFTSTIGVRFKLHVPPPIWSVDSEFFISLFLREVPAYASSFSRKSSFIRKIFLGVTPVFSYARSLAYRKASLHCAPFARGQVLLCLQISRQYSPFGGVNLGMFLSPFGQNFQHVFGMRLLAVLSYLFPLRHFLCAVAT